MTDMKPEGGRRRGPFAWLRTFGKGLAEGINPVTALRDFLSDAKGLITAITLLLLVVTILFLLLRDSRTTIPQPPAEPSKQPDESGPTKLDDESQVSPVAGRDAQGRTATFDVFVWDQRFNWIISENAAVELVGHSIAFGEHLAKPAIQARMQKAQALIAVGSASQEVETAELEERRSDDRASQLATWLEEAIDKPTYTLSLGRYQPSDAEFHKPGNTTRQRPIAIVGITGCTDGVVLKDALADALYTKGRDFPFDSHKYRRFDLNPSSLSCLNGVVR